MANKIDQYRANIEELNKFIAQATNDNLKDDLSILVKKYETKIIQANETLKPSCADPVSVTKLTESAAKLSCSKTTLNTYAWDDSGKTIQIFLDLKDVQTIPAANVTCEYTTRGFALLVKELNNRHYELKVNNLFDPIRNDTSSFKIKKDKIIITLVKDSDRRWTSLTKVEDKIPKPKMDETSNPNESIMNLIQNMYETGDDEMKRSIAKAWTESRNKPLV